jgi:hypothetical protein
MMLLASSCALSRKHVLPPAEVRPSLEATKDQLLAKYNRQANSIRSVNVAVVFTPTTGSAYSGVIEEYHEVNGFILASKPAQIRVIGQAPVVAKDVFDMTSDGETFRVFIPSQHKFIVGSTKLERSAKKPIENLRPQHLLDVFFWPEIPAGAPSVFEEWENGAKRFYILTALRQAAGDWEIARKVWFDRADFEVARIQIFATGGRIASDIRYAEWALAGDANFPRHIWLARPHEDYQLEIRITKVEVNEMIADDRFRLEQPPGTELVRAEERSPGARP